MPVLSTTVLSHYATIAGVGTEYDKQVDQEVVNTFIRAMDLQDYHYVVDVGAGACLVASAVAQQVGMRRAVLCVDPSQEMLNIGQGLPGVETYCGSEVAWVSSMKENSVDRVYIRQAVHHFDQEKLPQIFGGILKVLKPGGKLCISKRGDLEEMFPWPEGFYEERCKEEVPIEGLRKILEGVGFINANQTKLERQVYRCKVELFQQFRKRFVSWLSLLTEQEIEDGIAALDVKHEKEEEIAVVNRENFLTVEKCNFVS